LIEIKQSFNAKGSRIYEVPLTDFLIKGAEVNLLWNGKTIPVLEESQGKYRGQSGDTVRMGDIFTITISHQGRTVTSRAEVPQFDIDGISFSANSATPFYMEEAYTQDSIPDTIQVWTGRPFLEAVIPFVPDFMAFIWYSLDADVFEESYQARFLGGSRDFQRFGSFYLGENFTGFDSLSFYDKQFAYFLDEEKPTDQMAILRIGYKLVIPEPIYAEYHTTYSSVIVPITITNVIGGVGLFMGAIRYEGESQITVGVEME
jgi:hypothetical protein